MYDSFFKEDLLCSDIFCTFHPELVYFSRLRSCLFLKSWGPSRFLIPAVSEKKYLFSDCPWPGHWFHCEGCLRIPRTMCVMGGPLHASLLYMRGYMSSWILVCWSSVVLSVKPYGAPGLGQGSKFMASTEASFNLLLRWLRTRVVLFIDLNYFMITWRCSHIFCFSIEVYNYPFPGYELLVYGAATHSRTSLDQRVTSLTFLEELPSDLSLSSGLQQRAQGWVGAVEVRKSEVGGHVLHFPVTWMDYLFLIFLRAVIVSSQNAAK